MSTLFATDAANTKPQAKDLKLSDGGGLYLLVRTNGAELWRLNYRYLAKGRTLAFGAWPRSHRARSPGCSTRPIPRSATDRSPKSRRRRSWPSCAPSMQRAATKARPMRTLLGRIFRYAVATMVPEYQKCLCFTLETVQMSLLLSGHDRGFHWSGAVGVTSSEHLRIVAGRATRSL